MYGRESLQIFIDYCKYNEHNKYNEYSELEN